MKSILAGLVLVAVVANVGAVRLFQACFQQADCSNDHSECRILSPTCGHGTCVCAPGFFEHVNGTEYTCRRMVEFGQPCMAGYDTCQSPNADCINGKCDCKTGYTEIEETCSLGVQPFGGRCRSNWDCYQFGNLVCRSGECGCHAGYRQYDKYRCSIRQYGDACTADRDCQAMPYAACVSSHCGCQSGATAKPVNIPMPTSIKNYLYDNVAFGYACYSNDHHPSGEGESCFSGDQYVMVSDMWASATTTTMATTKMMTTTTTQAPTEAATEAATEAPATEAPAEGGEEGAAAAPEIFNEEEPTATGEPGSDGGAVPEATEAATEATTEATTEAATSRRRGTSNVPTTQVPVAVANLQLCRGNLQCTYCTLDKPICGRMVPMSSAPLALASNAALLLTAIAFYIAA